ncbi:hypothetical protein [Chryseobacterium aquaticum]|uniref:hypothetical protein n=1 Tax=Chryseobacterium aquaticum TaxID=452084 RepID=UPI000A4F8902|nr:hypothetical protein [Chryseobacterium aquaticum]
MKALKIYSIISTIVIVVLSFSLYSTDKEFSKTKKDYKETEEVLKQCSDRYYKEIGK